MRLVADESCDFAVVSAVRSAGHDVVSITERTLDLASPGLLRMLQKNMASQLRGGGAALQFAPSEGAAFFEPHGWVSTDVQGLMKTAVRLRRAPLLMQLFSLLPEPRVIPP